MLADIIEANPPNRLLMTGVIAGLSNSTRYLLRIRAEILYPYCSSDLVGVYTSYISVLTSAQRELFDCLFVLLCAYNCCEGLICVCHGVN